MQSKVPRLGVRWELPMPAYSTATAMQDPSSPQLTITPDPSPTEKPESSWILVRFISADHNRNSLIECFLYQGLF